MWLNVLHSGTWSTKYYVLTRHWVSGALVCAPCSLLAFYKCPSSAKFSIILGQKQKHNNSTQVNRAHFEVKLSVVFLPAVVCWHVLDLVTLVLLHGRICGGNDDVSSCRVCGSCDRCCGYIVLLSQVYVRGHTVAKGDTPTTPYSILKISGVHNATTVHAVLASANQ